MDSEIDRSVAELWARARLVAIDDETQRGLADDWLDSVSAKYQPDVCSALLRNIFTNCTDLNAPLPHIKWCIQDYDSKQDVGKAFETAIGEIVESVAYQEDQFHDTRAKLGHYWPAWSLVGAFADDPDNDPRPVIEAFLDRIHAPAPAHHASLAYKFFSHGRRIEPPRALIRVLEKTIGRILQSDVAENTLFVSALFSPQNEGAAIAIRSMIGALLVKLFELPRHVPDELGCAAAGMVRLAFAWPEQYEGLLSPYKAALEPLGLKLEPHPERHGWVRFTDESAVSLMKSMLSGDFKRFSPSAVSLFLHIFSFTEWPVTEWPERMGVLEGPVILASESITRARSETGQSPLDRNASAILLQLVDVFDTHGERASMVQAGRLDLSLVVSAFDMHSSSFLFSAYHEDADSHARLSAHESHWLALRSEGFIQESDAVFSIWLLTELASASEVSCAYAGTVRFLRDAISLGPVAQGALRMAALSQPESLLARLVAPRLEKDGLVQLRSKDRVACVQLVQDALGKGLWLQLPTRWKNTYIDMQLQWERLVPALNAGVEDLGGLVVGYAKLFETEVQSKFKHLGGDPKFRNTLKNDFGLSINTRTSLFKLVEVLKVWSDGKANLVISDRLTIHFNIKFAEEGINVLQAMMPMRNTGAHAITDVSAAAKARNFFLESHNVESLRGFLNPPAKGMEAINRS